MIRNALLNPQLQPPSARPQPVCPQSVRPQPVCRQPVRSETAPAETDVVQALVQAVQRPGNALELPPGTRTPRPFDAQYWACWVVTVLFPVVVAYLWITH